MVLPSRHSHSHYCNVHNALNCPDAGCLRVQIVKEMLDQVWLLQGWLDDYDADKWSEEFKDRAVELANELEELCNVEVGKRG
jgi:hypothetical protein